MTSEKGYVAKNLESEYLFPYLFFIIIIIGLLISFCICNKVTKAKLVKVRVEIDLKLLHVVAYKN